MTAVLAPPEALAGDYHAPTSAGTAVRRDPYPALRDVVELGAVSAARPRVSGACASLSVPVRAARVVCFGESLWKAARNGEVLLLDHAAVPDDRSELVAALDRLAAANISALAVSTDLCARALPGRVSRACERAGIPLIEFVEPVELPSLAREIDSYVGRVMLAHHRAVDEARNTLTSMCLAGASARELLATVSRLAGCPAMLEDSGRHLVGIEGGASDVAQSVEDWWAQQRGGPGQGGAGQAHDVARSEIASKGRVHGWLTLFTRGAPTPYQSALVEHAASTFALVKALDPATDGSSRPSQLGLISDLLKSPGGGTRDLMAKASILGVDFEADNYVALVADLSPQPALRPLSRGRHPDRSVSQSAKFASLRVIAESLSDTRLCVVVAIDDVAAHDVVVSRTVECIRQSLTGLVCSIAVSATAHRAGQIREAVCGAVNVADLVAASDNVPPRRFYTSRDLQLKSVLQVLKRDDQLEAFVHQALGPLLDSANPQAEDLLRTLGAYLNSTRNKSAAAHQANLSRSAFYHHLSTIEEALDVDLDCAETCTWLHAALMALRLVDRPVNGFVARRGAVARNVVVLATGAGHASPA